MSSRRVLASVKQNQANLKRVGILAQQEVRSVSRLSRDLTDLQTVGLVRDTVPVIASRYGSVNASTAAVHYNELRDIAFDNKKVKSFNPVVPALAFAGKVEGLLDYGIASNFITGRSKMFDVIINGITNVVADYARETIEYNAEADRVTKVTVQRVAEPNACAFCSMLAVQAIVFEGIGSPDDFTVYEDDWHNNCNCSKEVVFDEQTFIRPPYYEKMEEVYEEAYQATLDSGESITSKNIASQMRELGGLK